MKEIHDFFDEHGRPPKQSELSSSAKYTVYEKLDVSYPELLEELGYEPYRRRNFHKNEVDAELKRVTEKLGHTPRRAEFTKHANMSSDAVMSWYDRWQEALEANDISPRVKLRTEEECLDALREVCNGHYITTTEYEARREPRHPHVALIQRHCNGWSRAFIKIDINPPYLGNPTRQDCVDAIRRAAERLGGDFTSKMYTEAGYLPSIPTINRIAGFNVIKSELGLPTNRVVELDETTMINEIRRKAEEFGRVPKAKEMYRARDLEVSGITIIRHFGTWNKAVKAAGFEPRADGDGSRYWHGANWDKRRRQIRKRDRVCQHIGCDRDNDISLSDFGCKLPVHHLVPARLYRDKHAANHDANLVCLCSEHHPSLERLAQDGDVNGQLARLKGDRRPPRLPVKMIQKKKDL